MILSLSLQAIPFLNRHFTSRIKAVLKMFFVMGITWIADVLTFGLQWAFGAENIEAVS
jgi:hypothetical protein